MPASETIDRVTAQRRLLVERAEHARLNAAIKAASERIAEAFARQEVTP